MKLVPAGATCRIPWGNGDGVTTEIAIVPAGATSDRFNWRMSTAWVDTAGPFLRFIGIDRPLAVIAGGRLMMHRTEAEITTFMLGEALVRFSGEADVHTTLDTPLPNPNVMTWRDAWAHHAEVVALAAGERRSLPRLHAGMQQLVYCVHGVSSVSADDIPRGAVA